jgi:hypothetical protein
MADFPLQPQIEAALAGNVTEVGKERVVTKLRAMLAALRKEPGAYRGSYPLPENAPVQERREHIDYYEKALAKLES